MVAKKWTVEILDVAPVRERGLKFSSSEDAYKKDSRSREGAWIEMQEATAQLILI